MEIRDKVVLITGARRIGAVVAGELAARGAHIAVTYRTSREAAEAAAADVRAKGRRALLAKADLSHEDQCRAAVAKTLSDLGRLDVLVNMASLYGSTPFDELTVADLEAHLAVDLKGSYCCALAAVPAMRRAGGGRIINVTDWVADARRPRYKGYLTYYVAKAAVIALTEALALELAGDGILVNAIAPGPILAPADLGEEEARAIERATPLGRWGGAGEIAKAVIALVESDFVTGEVIRVDGGRHLR